MKAAVFSLIFVSSALALAEEPASSASPAADVQSPALPRVELRLPRKDGVKVGDVLDVELSGAELPAGSKLKPAGGLGQGWIVSESGKIGVLKPGPIQLPALQVVDGSGRAVAETDPVELNAGSVLENEKTEDGKPPQPEPPAGPQSLGLPIGLQAGVGLVFFGLLGTGCYILYRRLRKAFGRPSVLPATPQSADSIALRRLSLVESERWYEKGQHKRLAFEISEALKAYFSDRYSIDATESTTTELMEKLGRLRENGHLDVANLKLIQNCFSVLDLVKFTDYRPEISESVAQLEEAREIVVRTKKPFSVQAPVTQSGGAG